MKKEEKQKVFNSWEVQSRLNKVKDLLNDVGSYLDERGLPKEADQLMRMIFKVEAFQNKH